jgi:ElaB/YqjD/DUF883 family membrane-anchored ribosome-binding protein
MVKKRAGKKTTMNKGHKKNIRNAVKNAENKIMANYKKAVSLSGRDWSRESKKYRKIVKRDMAKAHKKIETAVKKNPAGAAVAAAAVGAIAGALLMSVIKKRKK